MIKYKYKTDRKEVPELSSTELSAGAKASRAQYQKEWRKRNPGKTKEYLDRYWERKSRQLQELSKAPDGEKTE